MHGSGNGGRKKQWNLHALMNSDHEWRRRCLRRERAIDDGCSYAPVLQAKRKSPGKSGAWG
jgi:hypothetical protein